MTRFTPLLSAAFIAVPMLAAAADEALIEKGRYVATAADCAACHTGTDGTPFAGGYAISSPMGAIIATNITPSKSHGIGNWSEAEFARALRDGVAPEHHLYPAMPYTAYAGISDDDMQALYAYMMSIKPVDAAPAAMTALAFPYNQRWLMAGWNLMFAGGAPADPATSGPGGTERGEYLVNSLAHCQTCHTPRNVLMGEQGSAYLAGADLGGWHAPNITSDKVSGIGGWSDDEIVAYLKTGRAQGKAQAGGAMAEAVEHSFRHLQDADLLAIARYLKTVPAIATPGQAQPSYAVTAAQAGDLAGLDRGIDRAPAAMSDGASLDGAQLYAGACAACHQLSGAGTEDQFYPSLTANSATGGPSAGNLVMAIAEGIHRVTNEGTVAMPAFGEELSDAQIAAVSNYVLARFGNAALQVTPAEVTQMRAGGETPWLIRATPALIGAGIAVALVVLLVIVLVLLRRRRRFA